MLCGGLDFRVSELEGGHLISLQEIVGLRGTSSREILDLVLLDRIMCPLQDSDGLIGWPRDYVDFIVSIAAERRAGRHMRPQIHDTRKGWHVEFMEEPVATPSVLPMFFVCERARQDVKVALIVQKSLVGRDLGVHADPETHIALEPGRGTD